MSIKTFFRLDLRRLILLLAFTAAAITLVNGLYASHEVQRQLLIDQTLHGNSVYANKLASSTDNFLRSAQQQLAYSASEIAMKMDDSRALLQSVERLRFQTDSFNSVAVINAQGIALATSPKTLQLKGKKLSSPETIRALEERRQMISAPFVSTAGNLLVLISQPIVSPDGTYMGFLGGTIYLTQHSILNDLLGTHFYRDGSYLYVIDQNSRILYHPEKSRIGEQVLDNPAIQAVTAGQAGTMRLHNSYGAEVLAGYAPIKFAGWGVVAQRPLSATLSPLDRLMKTVIDHTLPLALITLLLTWWLARLVSRPLWQLADSARDMDTDCSLGRIAKVRSWYFESAELKRAMLVGVNLLHTRVSQLKDDAHTDPLTHLINRRGLELSLAKLQLEATPFTALAIDIDHFKRINDSYGHDIGDQVLQSLALIMRSSTRKEDLACRTGGEEFIMILPHTDLDTATALAERLRQHIATTEIAPVGAITASIGIAAWPLQAEETGQVLKFADKALYKAKASGRNCCFVHEAG